MSIIIKDSAYVVAVIIDVNMQYRNVGDLGRDVPESFKVIWQLLKGTSKYDKTEEETVVLE